MVIMNVLERVRRLVRTCDQGDRADARSSAPSGELGVGSQRPLRRRWVPVVVLATLIVTTVVGASVASADRDHRGQWRSTGSDRSPGDSSPTPNTWRGRTTTTTADPTT